MYILFSPYLYSFILSFTTQVPLSFFLKKKKNPPLFNFHLNNIFCGYHLGSSSNHNRGGKTTQKLF